MKISKISRFHRFQIAIKISRFHDFLQEIMKSSIPGIVHTSVCDFRCTAAVSWHELRVTSTRHTAIGDAGG